VINQSSLDVVFIPTSLYRVFSDLSFFLVLREALAGKMKPSSFKTPSPSLPQAWNPFKIFSRITPKLLTSWSSFLVRALSLKGLHPQIEILTLY
jgi:hypothetical protein